MWRARFGTSSKIGSDWVTEDFRCRRSAYLHSAAPHPYNAGLLFCQIIATVVSQKHPKIATVERSVRARGPRVYIDYLQNILGKTLATAYSARASDYAGVSTPLTWKEVDEGVRRQDFTMKTIPARLKDVGIWGQAAGVEGCGSVKRFALHEADRANPRPGNRRTDEEIHRSSAILPPTVETCQQSRYHREWPRQLKRPICRSFSSTGMPAR